MKLCRDRSKDPVINTAQLKEGERAVNRIVRMREIAIKAKYRAERRTLQDVTNRKFNISQIEAEIEKAEDMLRASEAALTQAERKAGIAMRASLAKIDMKESEEIAEAHADGIDRSLMLIAASLPADAVHMIGLDNFKTPRLLEVASE